MKMKKFIKEMKKEQLNIPPLSDKVRNYAYQKEFTPVEKPKVNYFRRFAISMAVVLTILIPLSFVGIIGLGTKVVKDLANNKDSAPNHSESDPPTPEGTAPSDPIQDNSNLLEGPKKELLVNDQIIKYPALLTYQSAVNSALLENNRLYWINDYNQYNNIVIDKYTLNNEEIIKNGVITISTNNDIISSSLYYVNDSLLVMLKTKTEVSFNYYDNENNLTEQYVFNNDLIDFFIKDNCGYIIFDNINNANISYQHNKINKSINNIDSAGKQEANRTMSLILKIDFSNGNISSLEIDIDKIHYVYHSNNYLYLVNTSYSNNSQNYITNISIINLNTLTKDNYIQEIGYICNGDVLMEINNNLYFFIQDYGTNELKLNKYSLTVSKNNLVKDSSMSIGPRNAIDTLSLSYEESTIKVIASYFNQYQYEHHIDIIKWTYKTDVQTEINYENAYLVGDYYLIINKKTSMNSYDNTTFTLVDRVTNKRITLDNCIYDYYFQNYLFNYYQKLNSSILRNIESNVGLITNGDNEIFINENNIYLPVRVVRPVVINNQTKLLSMIDYWKFEIKDEKMIFVDIISNYNATKLSNTIITDSLFSSSLSTISPYCNVSMIVSYNGYIYSLSPNMVVSYIENDIGQLVMNSFTNK